MREATIGTATKARRPLVTALGLLLAALATLASPAAATVPSADRIQTAVAAANVAAGRSQALRLELSLQVGDRPAVATAELVSHPTGLARLELRGADDLIERHLLQGSELMVSRGGRLLKEHRAFLPPYFVLQVDSSLTLRAALVSFGVLVDEVGLSDCGDSDCFVIGDLERAVPPPELREVRGLDLLPVDESEEEPEEADESGEEEADEALATRAEEESASIHHPRVWVDMATFEVRGMDDGTGVKIRLGPIASFGELRVPAWIRIEEPGKSPIRFDVTNAAQVTAGASAFTRSWLLSPVVPESSPALSSPDPVP